jgi:tRNA1(Val) A37 N6-methylase TrmN6
LKTAAKNCPFTTTDALFGGALMLRQHKKGYRFTSDAVVLAWSALGDRGRVIDLGAGCGVVSIIIARFGKAKSVAALELQPLLCGLIDENAELNSVRSKVEAVPGNICRIKRLFGPHSFDAVVTNPPYIPLDFTRLPPGDERAIARHELAITLPELLDAANYLLKGRGVLRMTYPNDRLPELLGGLVKRKLYPRRLRFVHDSAVLPAKVVLLEAVKGAGAVTEVLPPLIFNDPSGQHTAEYEMMLSGPVPEGGWARSRKT